MKTKNKMKLSILAALTLTALSANGQITILATGKTNNTTTGTSSYTLSSSFNASGADKLVVTVSGERNSGTSGTTSISGVTYNGVSMTRAIQSTLGYASGPAAIFYLDHPGAAGPIVATASRALNGVHASWLALSDTADGVGATNAAAGASATLTNAMLNALVVAHNHANNGTVPVAQAPLTALLSSNGGNSDAAAGYQFVSTTGTVTSTFTTGLTPVTVAAMFNVDPVVALVAALKALKDHVTGVVPLTDTQISDNKLIIDANVSSFGDSASIISNAFALVTAYDTTLGPLFVTRDLPERSAVTNDIHWTIFTVMQDIMDVTYKTQALTNFPSLFNGFKFGSVAKFPGNCAPPADPNQITTTTISASYLNTAGRDTMYDGPGFYARKPTGTYLAPGTIATVIVPASLVGAGYKIRVGAHTWDFQATGVQGIRRLDRATIAYDINARTNTIASPLGGGIYIDVPWLANGGPVNVQVKGAVRSPYFSAKSIHTTTPAQWLTERTNPAPWADFQTDKFMMQVPSNWISAMPDPTQLMADWDASVDAINYLMGFPSICAKETLYFQVDVGWPYGFYATGYPAVNNGSFDATGNYGGYKEGEFFIRGPQFEDGDNWSLGAEFHEKGHGFLFPRFSGEIESAVNLLYVPVLNQKFGWSLDKAFHASECGTRNTYHTLDTTAIAWMTCLNFTISPMTYLQKQYQLKGHAKYVEIARLFGWDKLRNFWFKYAEDNQADLIASIDYLIPGISSDDYLILDLSKAVGKDVRPLLHFWGINPANPSALEAEITAAGLPPSSEIYNALLHYDAIVPVNSRAFHAFALNWWEREPRIGTDDDGVYGEEQDHRKQWENYNESTAVSIRSNVQGLITTYFPEGAPADSSPLEILNLSPSDNGTSELLDNSLRATFNKMLVLGSGNITLRNLTDSVDTVIPVGDSRISVSGAVLTINPGSALQFNKNYAVRIDSTAIVSNDGYHFVGISNDTTWNFITESPIFDAITALKNHITGAAPLSAAQIEANKLTIDENKDRFGDREAIISAAFDLVTTYDTTLGPLFVARGLPNRSAVTNDIHWTIFTVMQDLMDLTYTTANIANSRSLLNGFKFGSVASFPGSCAPPADSNQTYTTTISASYLNTVGRDTIGDGPGTYARKPTGTYLAPGTLATVIVPPALVGVGYKIRVGAHTWDMSADQPSIRRLDRTTIAYDITGLTNTIASPLGGGIYIDVPWLANGGTVSVQVKGAVRSPYFSAKSIHTTTPAQWLTERANPAPWADFQTDKFMLNVPTSWISAMPDPTQLMADWDASVDAITDLMGFPRICGKETLYLQVDISLPYTFFASGYPAVNNMGFVATGNYGGFKRDEYLVRGPQFFDGDFGTLSTQFHEKGHGFLFPTFGGETESSINLLYVPVLHQKFGISLDQAFRSSMGFVNTNQTLDTTARAWMSSLNFTPPNNTPMAEAQKAYQLKGHAKYVDIARLFGWDKLRNFWLMYVEDQWKTSDTSTDSLLLNLSKAVGKDVRPLLHFWGIYPENATTLGNAIATAGLTPSLEIYNALLHYKAITPANNAAFRSFALGWWGREPRPGGGADGVYWEERDHRQQWLYYNETSASGIQGRIQDLITLYFPTGAPADTTPPTVVTLSPRADAIESSVGANLVMTFSKPVVIKTGNITLKNLTDATQSTIAITDASQVSVSDTVLTINPTANLLASKKYAIRMAVTAIDDVAGNSFAGLTNDTTWCFTTQSANSGLFTWDGTANTWTSAHWNAGGGLVAGPVDANNSKTALINGGTVTFAASDTFGNALTMSSPPITINSGGTLASGGFFNTLWDLTLNGGTLLPNGGSNAQYGAFALKGTVKILGSTAATISAGAGSFNTILLGTGTGGSTTFNVADVTASSAPDLTISTALNDNSTVASGLIKSGAGTLTLSGANTYSGATVINAGILRANTASPNSSCGAGAVSVNAGGTLSGNGRIGGPVAIANAATAVFYPNSGNTLTFGNNLTFGGSSSMIKFDLSSSAASGNDKGVLEHATLTCNGAQITINSAGTLATDDYVLFDVGASGTISGSFNTLPLWAGTTPSDALRYSIVTVGKTVVLRYTSHPVTGAALWLDASQLTGLANGATVTTWTDISGNGNNATATGSAATYQTGVLNGQPVVRFHADGNASFNFTENTAIQTVFWVVKKPVDASYLSFMLGDSGAYDFHPENGVMWASYASGNILAGTTKVMGAVVNGQTTPLPKGTFQLVSLVTPGPVRANQLTADRGIPGRSWSGDMAEVIIYNRALTTAEELAVGKYLAEKYGLFTEYNPPVTWGSAHTMTSDADVATAGTLAYAYGFNTATTVNTVPFAAGSSGSSLGTNVTMSGFAEPCNGLGSASAPFANLSASYQAMTAGAITNGNSITLKNLIPGHSYLVQIWVNDSRIAGVGRNETVTSTGGNTVTLDYNNTDAAGGVGQYIIGTFMSSGTSQTFTLNGNVCAQLNALQVRDLTLTTALFWDNNGSTTGFGTAAGTWAAPTTGNGSQGWSLDGTGGTLPVNRTSATTDGVSFGNSANGLGAGTITVSGTVSAGNMTFASGSGAITLAGGTIALADYANIAVDNASDSISSSLTGAAGRLAKSGSGTLTLTGANTYTGPTLINAGMLSLSGTSANLSAASAVTVASGGHLHFQPSSSDGTYNYNSFALNLTGQGTGNFQWEGSATVFFGGNNWNTYNLGGNVTVAGGVNFSIYGGANTINLGGVFSGTGDMSFASEGAAWHHFVFSGDSSASGYTGTYKVYSNGSATYAKLFGGNNRLPITATVDLESKYAGVEWVIPAVLDLNGNSQELAGLIAGDHADKCWVQNSGAGTPILTINNAGPITFNGQLGTSGTGFALTKKGVGTLALSGNNTYTGPTIVNAGKLQYNNAASANSTSKIIVNNGGSLYIDWLARGGTISTPIELNGSGGGWTLHSYVEGDQFTFTGPMTLLGNSQIQAFAGGSTLNFAGAIGGTGNLTLQAGGASPDHKDFMLLSGASTFVGDLFIDNYAASTEVKLSGGDNRLPATAVVHIGSGRWAQDSARPDLITSSALDLNGNNQTLAGLSDSGVLSLWGPRSVVNTGTLKTLTLNTASNQLFSGTIGGTNITGTVGNNLSLVKSGIATQTLTGVNTYIGSTAVSNGTLVVMQKCLATDADVSVASGAKLYLGFEGTNTVRRLYADGVLQERKKVYGKDKLPQALDGNGFLYVTEGSAPKGLVMRFR